MRPARHLKAWLQALLSLIFGRDRLLELRHLQSYAAIERFRQSDFGFAHEPMSEFRGN
jgi:hypothetical protein